MSDFYLSVNGQGTQKKRDMVEVPCSSGCGNVIERTAFQFKKKKTYRCYDCKRKMRVQYDRNARRKRLEYIKDLEKLISELQAELKKNVKKI